MQKQKLVVILGPTSSGKSALAVELARKFNGEVISADSRQVYRKLNIGTGKITKREMRGIHHHLLDVANPRRIFTAHDYLNHAQNSIKEIIRRGKLPIICGGTGFYIDALLGRIDMPPIAPNAALRARLEKKSAKKLFALLKKKDSARAATIDRHNKRRLIRALEIASARHGSKTVRSTPSRPRLGGELWLGIKLKKEALRTRIRARLSSRMRQGMVAEIEKLHDRGLSWKRMDELGLEYRYIARYLRGIITENEMLAQLETKIWQYAKRQLTYWRRNTDIQWIQSGQAKSLVNKFLINP